MPPARSSRRAWRTLVTLGGSVALIAAGSSAASAATQLFWGNYGGGIAALAGDGLTGSDLPAAASGPYGTVVDAGAGKVYWIATGAREIRYSDLDGSHAGVLDTGGATVVDPYGLALDPVAGEIYWINDPDDTIYHAKTDGSGGGTLYSGLAELDDPVSPAVDPTANRIYWANYGRGTIGFANLDGTSTAGTIITPAGSCTTPAEAWAVAVDRAQDTMYLQGPSIIVKMRLDGTGCEDLTTASGGSPSGMTFDPERNRLVFPNYDTGEMSYVDLASGLTDTYDTASAGVSTNGPAYPSFIAPPSATSAAAITRAAGSARLTCAAPVWSDGIPGMFLFRSPSSGNTFSWTRDGTTVVGATSATVTADAPGAYQCIVTASNGAGTGTSISATETVAASEATTPTAASAELVTSAAPVATKALAGGKVRTTLRLQYVHTGRFSFYLQDRTGKRIPLLRGSTVGTRVLRKTFSAPVVQDGKSGAMVTLALITKPALPAGATLRVVLRQADRSLMGQSVTATK